MLAATKFMQHFKYTHTHTHADFCANGTIVDAVRFDRFSVERTDNNVERMDFRRLEIKFNINLAGGMGSD